MLWQARLANSSDLVTKQDLIDQILLEFLQELSTPATALPWEVRAILAYAHEHLFSSELNVAEVRRGCQLRNNNVSTQFRCAVGVGLREYIESGRMAAAKRLLRRDELEIYLIAMSIGYEHQETFCRAFRRHAGCTPTEWREQARSRGGPT